MILGVDGYMRHRRGETGHCKRTMHLFSMAKGGLGSGCVWKGGMCDGLCLTFGLLCVYRRGWGSDVDAFYICWLCFFSIARCDGAVVILESVMDIMFSAQAIFAVP